MEYLLSQPNVQAFTDPKRLFVYGSLMKGFPNHKNILKDKVISCKSGRVWGILYHQTKKRYPAMIHGDGWVSGEFLKLKKFDKLISFCDKLEKYFGPNHPDNHYERLITEVKLSNGKTKYAWVYWYARNDLNSEKNPAIFVPSGDWREFMHRKN